MFVSPEKYAASANSCALKSRYASALPGSGLISERNAACRPNTNMVVEGWLRPVFDLNGESMQRFLPSLPTARSKVFSWSNVIFP